MVAVLRQADRYGPPELARKIVDLAISARDRSIDPADLRDATFTVSNIGAVGGRFGTPIIPYGTTAILSVGRADLQPVVERDRVVIARRFPLSLSYDRRGDGPPFPRRRGRRHRSLWCRCVTSARFSPT